MSRRLSLTARFMRVAVPTRVQVLVTLFLATATLVALKSTTILGQLGVTPDLLESTQTNLRDRFSSVSHSPLASNITLIAFWSVVGLIAYLACWAAYNLMVEARNEVTLSTKYQNLGSRRGVLKSLAIKLVVGVLLIVTLLLFKDALALALALAGPAIEQLSISSALLAVASVAVLATYLYLVFALGELLFSAWYKDGAFTDA